MCKFVARANNLMWAYATRAHNYFPRARQSHLDTCARRSLARTHTGRLSEKCTSAFMLIFAFLIVHAPSMIAVAVFADDVATCAAAIMWPSCERARGPFIYCIKCKHVIATAVAASPHTDQECFAATDDDDDVIMPKHIQCTHVWTRNVDSCDTRGQHTTQRAHTSTHLSLNDETIFFRFIFPRLSSRRLTLVSLHQIRFTKW